MRRKLYLQYKNSLLQVTSTSHCPQKSTHAQISQLFSVSGIIFHLSIANLCLFGYFLIFCFKVILGDNFSFAGQPIDRNLKETQNIDLNLQFRFEATSSTCAEVNTANGIYFCNYFHIFSWTRHDFSGKI